MAPATIFITRAYSCNVDCPTLCILRHRSVFRSVVHRIDPVFFLEAPGGINTVKQSIFTLHSSPTDSAPTEDGVKNHFPNERKKDAASLAIRTVHSITQHSRNIPCKMSATVYVDCFVCSFISYLRMTQCSSRRLTSMFVILWLSPIWLEQ